MRLRLASIGILTALACFGQSQNKLPAAVRNVGIDQKLGDRIPLGLEFRDETGRTVQIGDYFGAKPVILAPVYYECPMLCTQVLTGLVRGLRAVSFNAGKEFEVVAVSFNPNEQPQLAAGKKNTYLDRYHRQGTAGGWHFLTGSQQSIQQLMHAVGFRYRWDEDTKQFVHASGIMVLTPEGKLARYFYGIDFQPNDLRLGVIEASREKIASPVDQILLFCFHYDPITGKYGLVIMNVLRALALLTIGALLLFIVVMLRRDRVMRHADRLFPVS
jgi:protein SCO1/2